MNIYLAKSILKKLSELGVVEFMVCAGGRNAPLTMLLEKQVGAKVFYHFEESSAGFFALGRARQLSEGKKVAVITTSGTAVAELLPAVVEAHYQEVPLVLVTSDLPKRFENSGYPQSINQVGIFSSYLSRCVDVESIAEVSQIEILTNEIAPVQINIRFDEPLINEEILPWSLEGGNPKVSSVTSGRTGENSASVQAFLVDKSAPVVIVGGLKDVEKPSVINILQALGLPVYADSVSNLRNESKLQNLFLKSGEKVLEKGGFDSVIHIGTVPISKFWRNLETKFSQLPIISINASKFSGLPEGRSLHLQGSVSEFENFNCSKTWDWSSLKERDALAKEKLDSLLAEFPNSEPALINSLSKLIGDKALVYLGNSLPIREWDLVADYNDKDWRVIGNRGANGIDGQVSSFYGSVSSCQENWGILGDLTTLYDLSAPHLTSQLEAKTTNLVVVNNCGGQIFSKLFPSKVFINEHQANFKSFAELWGLEFHSWKEIPKSFAGRTHNLIELCPDQKQTDLFWRGYEKIWES